MATLALTSVLSFGFGLSTSKAFATGVTTYLTHTFENRTSTGQLALPNVIGSTNVACLTAGTNTSQTPIPGCNLTNPDPQGSGALRLTEATTNEAGGVTMTSAFPTVSGIDVKFDTYQYGGTGADGISLAFSVGNPSDPVPPTSTGPAGGHLGYAGGTAAPSGNGLPDGYLGIGADNYGNFTNSTFDGSGCTDPAWLTNVNPLGSRNPINLTLRGPGNVQAGYCLIDSTLNTSNKGLSGTFNPATLPPPRSNALVPVEFAMNPSGSSVTTASGLVVPANSMLTAVTGIGGTQQILTDPIPTTLNGGIPSGLYPAGWTNPTTGLPYLLFAGFYASTGGSTDIHEVNNLVITSLSGNPPVLSLGASDDRGGSLQLGGQVKYSLVAGASATGTNETQPINVNYTLPTGITATSVSGSGWSCSISGQLVTCTSTTISGTNPLAAGTNLPTITVAATVSPTGSTTPNALTSSGVASSTDALSAYASDPGSAGPALSLTMSDNQNGSPVQGGSITYTAKTSTLSTNGPETQPVTDSFLMPSGVTATSVSGTGWSCSISGQIVTCISTNVSSVNPLSPGSSLAQISIVASVSSSASTSANALTVDATTSSSDAISGSTTDPGTAIASVVPSGLSLSPSQGPAAGGATTIISGTGLAGASSVTFGTYTLSPCASGSTSQCFIVNSNGTLTIYTPPGTSGTSVSVSATTTSGTGSAGLYLYVSVPVLSLTATDSANGNFYQSSQVYYYVTAAATNSGAAETKTMTMTYTVANRVTELAAGGSGWSCSVASPTVTCTTTSVSSGNPLSPGQSLPVIRISASIGKLASLTPGAMTSNGSVSSSDAATANATDPGTAFASVVPGAITLNPTQGPAKGGNPVIISGSNLAAANTLTVNGTSVALCAPYAVISCWHPNSNGTITLYMIAGTAGATVPVVVTNPAGSTPAGNYTYYATAPALTQYVTDNQNGLLTLGGSVTYSLVTRDASTAGIEALPVTVTFTYPAGITPASASGAGWTCSSLSPTVICTTNNVSTSNPLNPGASLSPITVVASISPTASTSPGALNSTAAPTSSDTTTTPTASDPGTASSPPTPSGLSLSPTSGPASGGRLTVISGSNLSGTTSVTFGTYTLSACNVGSTSQCFSVNSDGSLDVYTPPGTAGNTVPVSATNVTGTAAAGNYTYYTNPVLTIGATDNQSGSLPLGGYVTYSVTSGSLNSGGAESQPVTVTYTLPTGVTPQSADGTGWSCAISSQVVTCTSTKISSSAPLAAGSSLQVISIEAAVSLSASTSPGALSSSGSIASSDATSAFIVDSGTGVSAPAPSGLSLAPNSGPASGGDSTIISGTGLKGTTSVTFGTYTLNVCAIGSTSQCFVINANGTLTVYAPPGTAGNVVAVSVTTPGGTGSAGNYTYTANPILSLSATDNQNGSLPLGGFVTYTLSAGATNAGGADPNQLNLTYTLPSGVTPTGASGTGWSCTIVGQDVICNSTGVTGSNPLLPGTTLSAIHIAASISSGASIVANALTSNGSVTSTSATSASANDPGTGISSSIPSGLYLSPTSGPSIGGTETVIHGTGLSGATSILFGTNTLLPCALGSTTSCFVINGDGTITVYTPPGTSGNSVAVTVTTPSGTGNAGNFLYTGNSVAYVSNAAYHLVYPVNLNTSTAMAPTQGMSEPNGIAVSPDSSTIYVTNATGNDVSAISTATGAITTTYTVGTDPKGIAITPNGKTLVVPNWLSASVTLINTQTSTTTTVSVPGRPRNAVISSDGNTAYIVVDQAGTNGYIVPLNLTTLTLGTSVTVGLGPLSAVISPNGNTAYVTNMVASSISVVNLASSTVTATLSVPSEPDQIVLAKNGSSAFVVCGGANEVVPLDLSATPPIIGTVVSGFYEPDGIAIDNSTGMSYVANFNSIYTGSLSSFNTQTGVLGTNWVTR